MAITARTTRQPTGIEPPPMVLVDGKEASGKTAGALSLSRDERIGPAYVVEVGELKADAYAVLGDFVMVDHDGTIEDVVDAINWVMDQPPIDERPPLLIIDSLTALWDLVKMDAERRARSTHAARKALESDPHAAIQISPNHWCQDDETECLVRGRGWCGPKEVEVGDVILTLNHDTGRSEWAPIEDIYRADVVDEPMYEMTSNAHSSLSTAEHRWPVIKTHGPRRWTTSAQGFRSGDRVPVAAPLDDGPEIAEYEDDFVRLAVAFVADGTYIHHGNVRIVKFSEREIEEMRRILTSLYGPDGFREHAHPTQTALGTSFVLRQSEARSLIDLCCPETKAIPIEFVDELTVAQRHLMVQSCMDIGDGARDGTATVLHQVEPARLEAFRYAAHLCGYKVTSGVRPQGPQAFGPRPLHWVRWTKAPVVFVPYACEQKIRPYTGMIWCPTTRNGTWFARRRGSSYFTGNSAAKEPFWYGWLNRARHWPGITVCCARGDEVLTFDDNGKPIPNSTTYRVEVEKGAPFMFGARVKVDYPNPARLMWANKLDLTIPAGGLELPIDGTLAHVVFDLLDAGKEASYRGAAAKQMVLASARARGLLAPEAKALAAQAWSDAGLPDKGVDRVPLVTMRKILDIVAGATLDGDDVSRAKAIFDRTAPSQTHTLDVALAEVGMAAVDLVELPLDEWSDVAAKVVLDWYATQRPSAVDANTSTGG